MKKRWMYMVTLFLFLVVTGTAAFFWIQKENQSEASVQMLTVDRRENPVGVALEDVSFGWQMKSEENGKSQSAYRIMVAETKEQLKTQDYLWDSGRVETDISAYIPYVGKRLEESKRYYWKVQVWDEDGKLAEEAETAHFDTCVQSDSLQSTEWISAPVLPDEETEAEEFCISFDVWMEPGRASFLWGADQGEYGKRYRMEFDTSQEYAVHRMMLEDENQTIWQQETQLKLLSADLNDRCVRMDIRIEQDNVSTSIDGEKIAESAIEGCELLGYGFYQDRGTTTTYYDNLIIQDLSGQAIIKEDFEEPEVTVFAPYKVTIEEGRLKVRHQYVLADMQYKPAPMFRKEFEVTKEVERAYLYVASVGIYEPYLNGRKVGENYFASGRQAFREQMKYDSYEITDYLKEGENVIGIILGHGWYDRAGYSNIGELGVKAQIVIRYEDGSKEVTGTDGTWKCYTDGPIRNDDMYNGEYYDAGKEQDGWNDTGFEEIGWQEAACNIVADPNMELVPNRAESITCIEVRGPVSMTEPKEGVYVCDFGQEFTGIVSLSDLKGAYGDCITILYSEVLNEENLSGADDMIGIVWRDNLLMAQNTDYYIMGSDSGTYTPTLVCRAFRYVQIEGLSEPPKLQDIEALVLSGSQRDSGFFESSSEELNKLYENIVWTQKSNYLDIPSDCPQRDERLGWSGDAQVFARSAAYNSDLYHFMDNYLYYLRESQNDEGAYADIVPNRPSDYGNNGWGDAGITITWYHYLQYGDKRIILDNYEAMCRYVDYLVETSEDFIRTKPGYGDHNAISDTPQEITNTALCAYVSGLLGKMAQVIEEEEDAAYFENIHDQYKYAWLSRFVQENGAIECWTQTAYTLGLAFDLFDDKTEQAAGHLGTCIAYTENHLNTGYIGTPFLLPVLVENGMTRQAYALLMQDTYPSWLYIVQSGATTVYERWNGYADQENGTYLLQGSLNHCGLGSVNEFLFRYVLGIEADEENPGFKHIILQPAICEELTYVKGSYESIYGTIVSEWEKEDGAVSYHIVIPANTSATLVLPDGMTKELDSGEHNIKIEQ